MFKGGYSHNVKFVEGMISSGNGKMQNFPQHCLNLSLAEFEKCSCLIIIQI